MGREQPDQADLLQQAVQLQAAGCRLSCRSQQTCDGQLVGSARAVLRGRKRNR